MDISRLAYRGRVAYFVSFTNIQFLVGLEAPLATLFKAKLPILNLARSVWREVKKLARYTDTPLELPLWDNLMFPHFVTLEYGAGWKTAGVCTVQDIYIIMAHSKLLII